MTEKNVEGDVKPQSERGDVRTLTIFFLISQLKHMLSVLKRTFPMRRFFRTPKTYVKTDW